MVLHLKIHEYQDLKYWRSKYEYILSFTCSSRSFASRYHYYIEMKLLELNMKIKGNTITGSCATRIVFFFFWLFFLGGVFFLTISINDKWTYVYMHVKTFFCEYCLNKIYKNGLSACSNQREKRQSVVIIVNKYSNVEIRWFSVCFINDLICF